MDDEYIDGDDNDVTFVFGVKWRILWKKTIHHTGTQLP